MTGQPTPPLLALNPTPKVAARINAVLRIGDCSELIGPMIPAVDWEELAVLGERHPGAPAVVDATPERANGLSSVNWRQLGFWNWATTPLIHYGRSGSRKPSPACLGIPFRARLRRGLHDDIDSLDAAILRSIDAPRVDRLLERVQRNANPFAHRLLRHALDRSFGASTVREASNGLGLAKRTLYRRCTELGIPAPGTILSLVRIFTVERLSAWSRQPGSVVALALGFSHRANYRRLARQRVGIPPSVIRERGGAAYLEQVIVGCLDGRTDNAR